MKTFTCQGRDRKGTVIEKDISALNRADALKAFEEQGVIPLNIREGNCKKNHHKYNIKILVLWGTMISLLSVLLIFLCRQEKTSSGQIHNGNEIRKKSNLLPSDVAKENTVTIANKKDGEEPHKRTENIQVQKIDKEMGERKAQYQNSEKAEDDHSPRGFKTPSDQLLAMLLSVPEGHDMPPLPLPQGREMDKMFLQSLTNQIVIYPDDPPSVVRFKERVAEEKEGLAQRFEKGESVAEIIKEYQSVLKEISAIRTDMILQIQQVMETEGVTAADKMREEVNRTLEKEGIPPIPKGRGPRRRRHL